jgi:hypothetical protein
MKGAANQINGSPKTLLSRQAVPPLGSGFGHPLCDVLQRGIHVVDQNQA